MALNQLIEKLNTITIIKISLTISLITELSLLYLNLTIEGNIKYFGYFIFTISIILTILCDKDLIFKSIKLEKKVILLRNVYFGLFLFIIIYYPLSFYQNYLTLKNSDSFFLFIFTLVITLIFHFLLITMLNTLIKRKKNNKNNKDNEMNDELIEDEIKKAMINE